MAASAPPIATTPLEGEEGAEVHHRAAGRAGKERRAPSSSSPPSLSQEAMGAGAAESSAGCRGALSHGTAGAAYRRAAPWLQERGSGGSGRLGGGDLEGEVRIRAPNFSSTPPAASR
jgi:hypothetical protein